MRTNRANGRKIMKKWNAVKYGWIGVLALAALARPAVAQTKIVVGVDGALTGPFAGTTAPPVDGLRIYVDRLKAAGGITGRRSSLSCWTIRGSRRARPPMSRSS